MPITTTTFTNLQLCVEVREQTSVANCKISYILLITAAEIVNLKQSVIVLNKTIILLIRRVSRLGAFALAATLILSSAAGACGRGGWRGRGAAYTAPARQAHN